MANIEKTFDFVKSEENLYNIDNYKLHSSTKAVELDFNGNVKLKNYNSKRNTENFYGDGRLGTYNKMGSENIRPTALYFKECYNHPLYGPCLFDAWWSNDDGSGFSAGDEVILHKKHIEKEDYLDELGEWETITIKEKIIDEDKVHYAIVSLPEVEFSTRTANSATLIMQYKTLELFDNTDMKLSISSGTYLGDPASKIWDSRRISVPDGIVFIKAQEEIIIGRGSRIGSFYGNQGAQYLYNGTRYTHGGAPLGGGTDNISGNAFNERLFDSRANNFGPYNNDNKFYSPGGMGHYGTWQSEHTATGRPHPLSEDLNENIYTGIGCQQHDYISSYHYSGSSGGGIVIIQTPKITFKDEFSKIEATSSTYGSNYGYGFGGGGSILVKAETIQINKNPGHSLLMNEDFPTEEAIAGSLKDADGNPIDARPREQNMSIFKTMAQNSRTEAEVGGLKDSCVAAPGQIQLEFDNIIIEDTEITFADVTDNNLKDIIADYRLCNAVSNLRNIDTVIDWTYDTNGFKYTHNHWAPLYETNTWYKFYTAGLKNIDIDGWYDLIKLTSKFTLPTGTEIKIAFSIDQGSNWKYIDLDEADPVVKSIDIDTEFNTKGNTVQEMEEYMEQTLLTQSFILPQRAKENKTFDLCVALKTSKESSTPLFDYIYLNYEKAPVLAAPIPINPYNGEEFNNEYVDFVWLQPSQKYGSIQNRIEINTIPNFDKDVIELKADEDSTSSSNGRIMIPYKESKYDNKHCTVNNFKLPYIKKRSKGIENAYDYTRHSFNWNPDTATISYSGGDEYFHKGQTIRLQPQADLAKPTDLGFMLSDITIPKSSSLKYHFDFTGMTDYSVSAAKVGGGDWIEVIDGGSVNPAPDLVHTLVPKFYKSSSSYIRYKYNPALIPNDNWLRNTNSKTIMCRFIPENVELNDDNIVFQINNDYWNAGWGELSVYSEPNQFNETEYFIRFRNGYSWYDTIIEATQSGLETVVVLQYTADNRVSMWVNGILMRSNMTGHYYDTQHSTYYMNPENDLRLSITFGNWYNANNDESFVGKIKEFAIWDTMLTQEEIQQVSKVPTYNLVYNIESDEIEWKRAPYFDHLSDYQYVNDRVQYEGDANGRWQINERNFCSAMNQPYFNNHKHLLIGTYCPNEAEEDSWYEHGQDHKPINGIPHLHHRAGWNNTTYKNQIVYLDNNSMRHISNGEGTWQLLMDHQRLDVAEDSIEMNFFYREPEDTVKSFHDIGILTGAFDTNENSSTNNYSRYGIIRKYKTGEFRIGVWVRHTNGTQYMQLDPTTNNVSTNLPYPLIPDTMYTLSWVVYDSISSSEFWLFSDFDENYKKGVKLWSQEMYNGHTPTSHGFATRDFNDKSIALNYPYENAGIMMGTGENPYFEPINLTVLDENSNIENEAGFVPRYDLLSYITSDYLKKLNFIDIKANSDNALTDIKFFMSFDGGSTWVKYDKGTSKWISANIDNKEDGMSANETMALSTYNFEKDLGFELGKSFMLRSVLYTNDSRNSPYLDWVKVSYNGPLTIDSWEDDGSFYNGSQFYYCNDGTWNPYLEPDFTGDAQNWIDMGNGIPDALEFEDGHGSKPSTSTNKVFAGLRVLLNPKGKYYWRIAAYNGQ